MGVCANFCCVSDVGKDSGVLSLGVMLYVVYLCRGVIDVFFYLNCEE